MSDQLSAIPVFEDSRAQWNRVEQVRDRALCLARLATAYAIAGEPEQAGAVITDLIAIADGLGSARVVAQIAELRAALTPWRRNPIVADLLHRLETFKDPPGKDPVPLGLRLPGLPGALLGPFLLSVEDSQPQRLRHRIVVRELRARLEDFPHLPVETLDGYLQPQPMCL